MKKRALLINPWIYDFAAYDFWARPAGLLTIASLLKRNNVEVAFTDCLDRAHPSLDGVHIRRRADGSGNFLKTIVSKPDAIGFVPRTYGRYGIPEEAFINDIKQAGAPDIILATSSMTYWYPGAHRAVELAEEAFPGVPVVLGGRYATLCPEHAAAHSGADEIYTGPLGPRFSDVMEKYTGVRVETPESFSDMPAPAHEFLRNTSVVSMALSAGCPSRCTYCVSSKLFPHFEQRVAAGVIDEIDFVIGRLGTKHISFCDDALLFNNRELLMPVLMHVIGKKYEVSFYTPNAVHASMIDEEVSAAMKQAGFKLVRLGLESADASFQKKTGGKVDREQFERAAAVLKSAGFRGTEVGAYFILGHPAQTCEDVEEVIDFARRCGVAPVPAEYSPIPGSADFEAAVESFKRNPAADPLLHNSSLAQYQHPAISPKRFQAFKDECRKISESLRRGAS